MKIINIFYIVFIFVSSCTLFKHNLWLNRFDVCCKIDTELFRDGKVIYFKDGFFQDKYVKLSFDYDLLRGIKLKIISECLYVSEINWDNSYYVDEYGKKHNIKLLENISLESTKNVSNIVPYTDFEITLIPQDYIYKEDNIWQFRQMLDPLSQPDKLKGKVVSLVFSFPCDEKIYNYTVNFKINPRYTFIEE